MRKPWFVRLAGWVFCLSVLFFVLAFVSKRNSADNMALFVMLWLGLPLMGVSLVVWMIGTMVAWGIQRQGKQTAAILRDLIAPASAPAVGGPTAPAKSALGAGPVNSSLTCRQCNTRRAALFCRVHGVPVCVPCLVEHDTVSCAYILASRVTVKLPASDTKAVSVVTSPLGLSVIS